MKSNQTGRSMIEMLGVLAIIGVLSVGGIAGYSKAMAKYRSNKVIEQVSMLITNIRTMYAQQQTYNNLSNAMSIEMGVVPDDLIVVDGNGSPTGALRNVFGGPVQIAASSVAGSGEGVTDKSAFVVSFYSLSRDACIAIATSDWGAGSSSGLLGMHVFVPAGEDGASADVTSVDAGAFDTDTDVTPKDTVIHALAKTDTANLGKGTAIPGDNTVGVPMRVDQARTACKCLAKANCAISWKYY